jgi:hypothetical protein
MVGYLAGVAVWGLWDVSVVGLLAGCGVINVW